MNRELFLEEVQQLIKAATPYKEKSLNEAGVFDPKVGFSCGGLVYYLYQLWGIPLVPPVDVPAIRQNEKDFDLIEPPAKFMDVVYFLATAGERGHLALMLDTDSLVQCDAIQKFVGKGQLSRYRFIKRQLLRYKHRSFET
ncbi:MAG: hypothetical protein ACREQ7_12825 [Candidatus Binatia bacterium]